MWDKIKKLKFLAKLFVVTILIGILFIIALLIVNAKKIISIISNSPITTIICTIIIASIITVVIIETFKKKDR